MSESSLDQRNTGWFSLYIFTYLTYFYSLFLKYIIFSSIFKLSVEIHYNTNGETQDKIYIQGYWKLGIIFSTGTWTQIPLKSAPAQLRLVQNRFAIHQPSFHNILVTGMIHPVLKQIWWTSPWRGPSLSHATEGAQSTTSGWMLHFRQGSRTLLLLLPLLPPKQ